MATIDYNTGSGTVTFFASNVSHPVWFCDNNTSGIQIATRGSTPTENMIQIGNISSTVKIHSDTTVRSIQAGPLAGSVTVIRPDLVTVSNTISACWMNPTEINLSSSVKKLTVTEEGIASNGIALDVKGGQLSIQGTQIQSNFAGGFNSQYLIIRVNNVSHKIALHDM